ncbi:zinc ribbon domain-containing protein [Calditrichota bacterium]
MQNLNYTCPKCGSGSYDVDEFRATGGWLTKLLDIQTKRFTTVSCSNCKYTEIYKAESSMLGNIFDLFTD